MKKIPKASDSAPGGSPPVLPGNIPVQPMVDHKSLEGGRTVSVKVKQLKDGTVDYKFKELKARPSHPPSQAKPSKASAHPAEVLVSSPNLSWAIMFWGSVLILIGVILVLFSVRQYRDMKEFKGLMADQPDKITQSVSTEVNRSLISVRQDIIAAVKADGADTRKEITSVKKKVEDSNEVFTATLVIVGDRLNDLAKNLDEVKTKQTEDSKSLAEAEAARAKLVQDALDQSAKVLAEHQADKIDPNKSAVEVASGYSFKQIRMGGAPLQGYKDQLVSKGQRSDWISATKIRKGMLYFSDTKNVIVVMSLGWCTDYVIKPINELETDAEGNLMLPNDVKKVSFTTYSKVPFTIRIQN